METHIGRVTHFFNHIFVAVLSLTGELKIGDVVHIFGHSTDFVQQIKSMEIDHCPVNTVGPGQEAALKVLKPVRRGDAVLKVSGPEAEQLLREERGFFEDSL